MSVKAAGFNFVSIEIYFKISVNAHTCSGCTVSFLISSLFLYDRISSYFKIKLKIFSILLKSIDIIKIMSISKTL